MRALRMSFGHLVSYEMPIAGQRSGRANFAGEWRSKSKADAEPPQEP